jgi:hypothetical protein
MDQEKIYKILDELEQRILAIEEGIHKPMPGVSFRTTLPHANFKIVLRRLCDKIGEVLNAVQKEKLEYKFYVQVIHHALESAMKTVKLLDINIDGDWARVVEEIKTLNRKMEFLCLISWTIDKRLSNICNSVAEGTNISDEALLDTSQSERDEVMLNLFKVIGMNLLFITKSNQKIDRNYFNFLGTTSSTLMWEIITLLTGGQVATVGR